MAVQADIQVKNHTLEVRLSGEFDGKIPDEARFGRLARTCKERHLEKLLVNVEGLTGQLGTIARLQLGMEFAQAFRDSGIRIAVIGNDAVMEARRFFELVVQGKADLIYVCRDVQEARAWLHREQGAPVTGG